MSPFSIPDEICSWIIPEIIRWNANRELYNGQRRQTTPESKTSVTQRKGILLHVKKGYLDLYLMTHIQLNISVRSIRVLEENIGVSHCELGVGSVFLDMTPKAQATKGRIQTLDLRLCALKDTTKNVKTQSTD